MMTWTPERITELKRLWATGASTAEIGRQLDVSKNAVVGKVHRLGLPGRPSPIRREARTVARPGVAESRPRSQPQIPGESEASPIMAQGEAVPRAAAEAECRAQAVVDLHAPPCQWPFGDPGEEDTQAALRAVNAEFVPNKVLAFRPASGGGDLEKKVPLLEGKITVNGAAAVYLCRNYACELPITDAGEGRERLRPAGGRE